MAADSPISGPESVHRYWKKALEWDSAFQMQYLHDFLASLEWWRLEQAHELIRNQPKDVTRRMVMAKTDAGERGLGIASPTKMNRKSEASRFSFRVARPNCPSAGFHSTRDCRRPTARLSLIAMLCYAAIIFCLIYHSEGKHKEPQGLDAFPAIRDVVGRMYAEIHAGKIKRTVPPVGEHEWMTILAGPMAQPSPGGKPAYDLDDPAKLASLVKGRLDRLSAEAFAVEYRSYPLISGAGCSGKPIRLWRWNSDSARRCWHQSATLRSL